MSRRHSAALASRSPLFAVNALLIRVIAFYFPNPSRDFAQAPMLLSLFTRDIAGKSIADFIISFQRMLGFRKSAQAVVYLQHIAVAMPLTSNFTEAARLKRRQRPPANQMAS